MCLVTIRSPSLRPQLPSGSFIPLLTWMMDWPSFSAICMKFWFWNMPLIAFMYLEGSIADMSGIPPAPGPPPPPPIAPPGPPGPIMPPKLSCSVLVTSLKEGSFAICSAIALIFGSCYNMRIGLS